MLEILDRYGADDSEPERERVQLAILKLCDERRDGDLSRSVDAAKRDYRDVLAWAEYPNAMKLAGTAGRAQREAARRLDIKQYEVWLRGSV